jgi:hypothetical protein
VKVAEAVAIDPLLSVASAVMVAPPLPQALTTPPFCVPPPAAVLLLLVTGKTFGADVIQVTEFVRSLTVGAVENVPIARNCPVSCRSRTPSVLGMMVSERMLPPLPPAVPPVDPVTVRSAVALTGPANPVELAVMTVEPALTAVATPEALMVATEGLLEVQVTRLVMFCVER